LRKKPKTRTSSTVSAAYRRCDDLMDHTRRVPRVCMQIDNVDFQNPGWLAPDHFQGLFASITHQSSHRDTQDAINPFDEALKE